MTSPRSEPRPPTAVSSGGGGAAEPRQGRPARLTWVRWLRTFGEVVRSGLTIEETRLEPLLALRTAAGVALVIGPALWLVSPAYAASAALGAYSAGAATFQRTWRPRKVIALGAGASLALSTFVGYLAAGRLVTFLPLLAVWAFAAGMAWALGSTAGIVAATTVGAMLVTITLPTSVGRALEHAGVIALGGMAQALLILLFPIRRWGAHRDALADALAAVADHARRLRHDPTAPFDPEPLMTARDRFAPEAERFAEALEADTARAADDVREHRNPDWGRVEEALHVWEGATGDRNPVLRRGAELQKRALDNLATAVSRTPLERDVGSAREEQRVRAAVAAEGDGSSPAHRDG